MYYIPNIQTDYGHIPKTNYAPAAEPVHYAQVPAAEPVHYAPVPVAEPVHPSTPVTHHYTAKPVRPVMPITIHVTKPACFEFLGNYRKTSWVCIFLVCCVVWLITFIVNQLTPKK